MKAIKYAASLAALLLLLGGSLPAAAPRLALVATGQSDAARAVLDLAEADLSAGKEVDLLDRSSNERILTEHALSLSGLVDAGTAVTAGKLLSADLFAVVETDPSGKDALGLVVFEAATGARLWDAALPAGGGREAAGAAVAGVRAAVRKHAAGPKNLRPVCLLGVRNADLPPAMTTFGQLVSLLLERRLASAGEVAVLERKRLELVNKERALTADAAEKELVASAVLIELEVRRAPGGKGVKVTAFLSDGKGKALKQATADGPEPDAGALADLLAADIAKYLHVTPAQAAAGVKAEGGSFLREAQLLWGHRQLLQGLQAAESAAALDPEAPESQAALAQYLLGYGAYLIDPKGMGSIYYGAFPPFKAEPAALNASLELARRGVEARAVAFGRLRPRTRLALGQDYGRNVITRAALRAYVNKLVYVDPASFDDEGRRLRDSFRAEVDRLLRDEIEGWAEIAAEPAADRPTGTPPDSPLSQYQWQIKERYEILIWNSSDAAAYTRTLVPILRRWLEVSAKVDPDQYQTWHLTSFLQETTPKLVRPFGARWEPTADNLAELRPIFEGMGRHPHPLVGLYGRAGLLLSDLRTGALAPADALVKFKEIRQKTADLIRDAPVRPADAFRVGCYKFLAFAVQQLSSETVGALRTKNKADEAAVRRAAVPIQDEFYSLCDLMLGRNEVVEDVLEATLNYGGWAPDAARKQSDLIDRALAVARSPECRLFDGNRDGFPGKAHVWRDGLATSSPAAAAGPGKADPPLWEEVRPLLDLRDLHGIQTFTAATVYKDDVYLVGGRAEGDGCLIQLIRLPLAGGPPQLLGKEKIGLEARAVAAALHTTVTACCVDGDYAYVATTTDGILRFDLSGGRTKRLGADQGLPDAKVRAMDLLDGKLYACLAGGYLVSVGPEWPHVEVLASSQRKEKASPFDDNPSPFHVLCLAADPDRHRLLFVLNQGQASSANMIDGVWEYDVKARAFAQRLRLARNGTVTWGSRARDGHMLFSSPWFALRYDLASDKAFLISGNSNPFPPGAKPDAKIDFTGSPPHLLRDGWLWTSYPFGRVSVDNGKLETFPTFANGSASIPFAAACLEPVAGNRLLVGSHTALYLVTLRTAEPAVKEKTVKP